MTTLLIALLSTLAGASERPVWHYQAQVTGESTIFYSEIYDHKGRVLMARNFGRELPSEEGLTPHLKRVRKHHLHADVYDQAISFCRDHINYALVAERSLKFELWRMDEGDTLLVGQLKSRGEKNWLRNLAVFETENVAEGDHVVVLTGVECRIPSTVPKEKEEIKVLD